MARMPRNQLLDLLFKEFREQPHWGIKPLREKTQQPEAYLKEVLGGIGFLHRSGEFNGMWELKDVFRDDQVWSCSCISALGLCTYLEGDRTKGEVGLDLLRSLRIKGFLVWDRRTSRWTWTTTTMRTTKMRIWRRYRSGGTIIASYILCARVGTLEP